MTEKKDKSKKLTKNKTETSGHCCCFFFKKREKVKRKTKKTDKCFCFELFTYEHYGDRLCT